MKKKYIMWAVLFVIAYLAYQKFFVTKEKAAVPPIQKKTSEIMTND